MKPGDRLVCAFVDKLDVNMRFKAWPLHLTIVPWFRTGVSSEELAKRIKESIKAIKPFTAKAGEIAHFGHRKSKEVNLIVQPSAFTEIERDARRLLNGLQAWVVDETTKRKPQFNPHVTVQKLGRLNAGDVFECDSVYIVEQLGNEKIVSAKIRL
jgi:2'-5' RNA ligase